MQQDVPAQDSERISYASDAILALLEDLKYISHLETIEEGVIFEAVHSICEIWGIYASNCLQQLTFICIFAGCLETLDKLFQFRRAFHRIASREAHDSSTVVVTWVDVILAKLGETMQHVVCHGTTSNQCKQGSENNHNGVLARHKEEAALSAALQLPGRCLVIMRVLVIDFLHLPRSESWSETVGMIASEYASPAATRLVICLLYAGTVLGLPVGQGMDWPYDE